MKTNFMKKTLILGAFALMLVVFSAFSTRETKAKAITTYHFVLLFEKGNTIYLSKVIDQDDNVYSSCKEKAIVAFQDYWRDKYNMSGRIWAANYYDLKTSQDRKESLNKLKNVKSFNYVETNFSYSCD